jgi:hypothetical protein
MLSQSVTSFATYLVLAFSVFAASYLLFLAFDIWRVSEPGDRAWAYIAAEVLLAAVCLILGFTFVGLHS